MSRRRPKEGKSCGVLTHATSSEAGNPQRLTRICSEHRRTEDSMRLTVESVDRASAAVKRPQYARTEVTPGIVHLGIGAFHRAHQAVVIDDVLERESGWGIIGVSFRRPDTKEALEPQDGLYTLLIKDGDTRAARIVGSLLSVLDARTEKERCSVAWPTRRCASYR